MTQFADIGGDAAPQANALAAAEARIAELEAQLAMFRSIADALPVGVAMADPRGEIVYGNHALARMVEHPVLLSKDAQSYGEWESYHADGRRVESHEYPLARVLREGIDRCELDVLYARGSGGRRTWMRIIGEPVRTAGGELAGAIVATVDVDAEIRLRDQQQLMIAELNHRVKNAFAVSQAIVGRILRLADSDKDLVDLIDKRLKAYAHAHARLVGSDWTRVTIAEVARDVLVPVMGDRVTFAGPDLLIPARNGLALSMAFYELATNASKHGALNADDGRVAVSWEEVEIDDKPGWRIGWSESGGPPPGEPGQDGFGTFIIKRALEFETGGKVEIAYPPEGLQWHLTMPLPHIPGEPA